MTRTERFSRQGFLGHQAEVYFASARIGVVGAGGGGSHIVQQLLHAGFKDIVVFDPDKVEHSNLNRMIGATAADADNGTLKVSVMSRLAKSIAPDAKLETIPRVWQESAETLLSCDVIVGCVDGFSQRHQLEVSARRYLIPYIDIGLDVHTEGDQPAQMAGQVILSMPGHSCMWCLGFLSQQKLSQEGMAYGAAGPRPQVVWANGVLASTAVGLIVDLLTDWSRGLRDSVYLLYEGNAGTLRVHPKWDYRKTRCTHYTDKMVGPAKLAKA